MLRKTLIIYLKSRKAFGYFEIYFKNLLLLQRKWKQPDNQNSTFLR